MVTPAMQQQPQVIYGPNGERAVLRNGEYIIEAGAPAAPAGGGYNLQPMITPAEQRAREERDYDRGRDTVRDQLTASREERAIETAARQAQAAEIANEKLTEDQGKAGGYAQLMADAERSYQQALREGFNPTGFRAGLANFTDNIPLMGGVGNFIRDDAGDRARQAELQWSDAQLKAMSGAASPEPEVVRNQITNFARPGQNYGYIGERLEDARRTAFESARRRAGRDLQGLAYPNTDAGELPIRDLLPDETPEALAASGRIRGSDGVWRYPRDEQGNPIFPEDAPGGGPADGAPPSGGGNGGGIADLITGRDSGYETALAQERAMLEDFGRRGIRRYDQPDFTSQITAPFNDELGFAAGYVPQAIANLGRSLTGQSIEVGAMDRGRAVSDLTREGSERFARERPVQNIAANVLGAATFGPGAAASLPGRMAQGASVGGVYGFADAQGSVSDRLPAAAGGAAIGAVAAPAVERIIAPAANALIRPVANAAGSAVRFGARQVGRAGNAMGVPGAQRLVEENALNPLASGMNRFADRSPQQVNALNGEAARFQSEQIAPTFADVVNDGGRGTLRALATRQTPARQAAREFADGRAAGLQDRISTQARRTISNDPRSPDEMRAAISVRRGREGDAAFGAVRNETVTPEPAMIEALRTPAGRAAVEDAATRAANRGDIETANGLRQLVDGALDNPSGVQITVGMADRIARTLNGRGEALRGTPMAPGDNDAAGALFSQAEALRGTARRQVQGYDDALTAYGDDSRLIQAATLGEQFMSMEADQFAAALARMSPEEQQIAQAAARRAVERQAGTQGQAPGVAQRLSNGREQSARTQALTGDAAPVQRAMGAELQALRNAQGISPAQGSPTSMNAQDAMGAAGAARDVMTGNVAGLAGRAMNAIRSRGFNDAEAEAIVTAAIDPAQTERLIGMLAERMTRREARSLARAIRYQLTTNPPSSQQR